MKSLILLFLLASAAGAEASTGWKDLIAEKFPGWDVEAVAEGDLRPDGPKDVAVVLKRVVPPANREDDPKVEASFQILAQSQDGSFRVLTGSAGAICIGCDGLGPDSLDGTPSIDSGILKLEYDLGGASADRVEIATKWRYDPATGKLRLIGETDRFYNDTRPSHRVSAGEKSLVT